MPESAPLLRPLMPILAAVATKSASKLHDIPAAFWLNLALVILAIIVAVFVLRKIAGLNKVVFAVVVAIGLTVVGFNWIYERNEPVWATPVVQWLAGFFPTKATPLKNR